MDRTIIGVFDTVSAARAARERLAGGGIDLSRTHLAIHPAVRREAVDTDVAWEGSTSAGIRDFFAELLGTEHSAETGHHAEAVRQGGVILAVDLREGAPAEPVRAALLEAGALDVNERIGKWQAEGTANAELPRNPYDPLDPDSRNGSRPR
ncbi:MAG TPA: hypothetical protein VFF03_05225 [Rhodocyclaceae bacterium]|nr:hypothetical protein [Rhodocyclaceae bacterium]